MDVKTCVTFRSGAFNTAQPQPHYVHPDNYGDDVARWFAQRLHERAVTVESDEPAQEDHGWYISFSVRDTLHDLIVIYAPVDDGAGERWLVCVERSVGIIGSVLGVRQRGVLPEATEVVERILASSDEFPDRHWLHHKDVRRGHL